MPRTRRFSLEVGWRKLAGAALLAGACGTAAPAPAAVPLTCTLQVPARLVAGQPALLQISLRNDGPRAVDFLVWGTPFEAAWFAPYVSVQRGSETLRYRGAKMKRGDPLAEDYLRVEAGSTRQASIDMAQVFDLTQPGDYRVTPGIVLHDVISAGSDTVPRPRERHQGQPLACPALQFSVTR